MLERPRFPVGSATGLPSLRRGYNRPVRSFGSKPRHRLQTFQGINVMSECLNRAIVQFEEFIFRLDWSSAKSFGPALRLSVRSHYGSLPTILQMSVEIGPVNRRRDPVNKLIPVAVKPRAVVRFAKIIQDVQEQQVRKSSLMHPLD